MCNQCAKPVEYHPSVLGQGASFSLGQEVYANSWTDGLTMRAIIDSGFKFFKRASFRTSLREYPNDFLPDNILAFQYYDGTASHDVSYLTDDAIIAITTALKPNHGMTIDVWGATKEAADKWMAVARKEFPEVEPPGDDGQIDLAFWMGTAQGPKKVTRRIEVPEWDNIDFNYTGSIRDQLGDMMNKFRPSHGGQLILWHGQPGTGKTYALRALGQAWRKWCEAQYVIDPERFFGNDADYLMSVLLEDARPSFSITELDDEDIVKPKDKWRLLIFEDTGELMADNAGERTGQGLSRLLNTVDGLIGQGLKIMLLVTTNEELEKLHPAVARSGRASVVVKFEYLDAKESVAWGKRHGIEVEYKPHPISDLYAALEGFRKSEEAGKVKPSIGFAPRS